MERSAPALGDGPVRVALVQAASPDDESAAARTERLGNVIDDLEPVDLIVLPELWYPGYFGFERYDTLAESIDGPLVAQVRSWATRRGVHIQAGSVLERTEDGSLYNTAILIAPDGRLLSKYRKIHVFGYQSLEARILSPGSAVDAVRTSLGHVGMTTCYDLRFPELYRWLGDLGAQIFVIPAAWPAARLEHWRILTRARALENQAFLIACNAAGQQRGVELAGHSCVVDPWGKTIAEAGAEEQIVYVDLDLADVAAVRAEFPVLQDRKIQTQMSMFQESGGGSQ